MRKTALQRTHRVHACDKMLIEKYFAKIGFAVCLSVLNIGVLFILLGNDSDGTYMRKAGTDAVIGALLLACVSSIVYFW